jgi:hypothetical protein
VTQRLVSRQRSTLMATSNILDLFGNNVFFIVSLAAFALLFLPSWIQLLLGQPKRTKPFLDPNLWQKLPLVEKKSISHNTRIFRRAALPALPHSRMPSRQGAASALSISGVPWIGSDTLLGESARFLDPTSNESKVSVCPCSICGCHPPRAGLRCQRRRRRWGCRLVSTSQSRPPPQMAQR